MHDSLLIDAFGPLPVHRPGSVADLGVLVRDAGAASQALYPFGGQTQLGLGRVPSKPGWAIDLRGLDQIIDFPARDMTITVQAGITLAKLQAIIAPENLRLPVDVPQADRATLGGILATNISGSRRFGFGTLRDYLIGVSAINDDGNEFKAGGRVVKNVAGYDLCKLLVGSLGTLGIITQATLKLRPLAEEQALACIPCPTDRLAPLLEKLHLSRTRPVILDLVNRAGSRLLFPNAMEPAADWLALVGYEGNADAVQWQVRELIKELGTTFPFEARVGYTAQPLLHAMTEWPAWPDARLTLKASVPANTVSEVAKKLNADHAPLLRIHAGNGIILGHYTQDTIASSADKIVALWHEQTTTRLEGGVIVERCPSGGSIIVQRCPSEWKASLNVWGSAPRDIEIMREVKNKFDPRRLFNPGRFVDVD